MSEERGSGERRERGCTPPRLARRLVAGLVPGPAHDAVLGDLEERHARVAARRGRRAAGIWYWKQALLFAGRLPWARMRDRISPPRPDGPADPAPRGWISTMEGIVQDLRTAARALAARPGFTAVVVLTLAVAIGVNSALFAVIDGVLLRPLPYEDADRLVVLYETRLESGRDRGSTTWPDVVAWRQRSATFEGIVPRVPTGATLTSPGEPESVGVQMAPPEIFELFRVTPLHGRFYTEEEQEEGADVVVLTHSFWQRRFGGDPHVVGTTVTLDETVSTVVGVLPPEFRFPHSGTEPAMWQPLSLGGVLETRSFHILRAIGRLEPGVTLGEAQAEMSSVAAQIAREVPDKEGHGVRLVPLHTEVVGEVETTLTVLHGAVVLVLLVAGLNVANMLVGRGLARRHELAVRAALGAGRWRLVRPVLAESLLLAGLGGAFGLLANAWLLETLLAALPGALPRIDEITVDLRVFAFTGLITVLVGLGAGLVPALRSARPGAARSLHGGARDGAGTSAARSRALLVVAEVAVSVVLLVGAGLMVKTIWNLARTDLGFDPEQVVAVEISLPSAYREPHRRLRFFDELLASMRSLPGVAAVGTAWGLPPGGPGMTSSLSVEGRPELEPGPETEVEVMRMASSGFFDALRIPLRSGRLFRSDDLDAERPVLVVSEELERRFFGESGAVGERVGVAGIGEDGQLFEIIGVVGDARMDGARSEPVPTAYVPRHLYPSPYARLVLRTEADPLASLPAVRQRIWELEDRLAANEVEILRTRLAESIGRERLVSMLGGVFALVALLLACIGVFGVMSYAVNSRAREIGVRMAVGARDRDIVRIVFGSALSQVGAGLALGLLGAVALTRFLGSLLFGVAPVDFAVFSVVVAALLAATSMASWLPARRATRVDPVEVLRAR